MTALQASEEIDAAAELFGSFTNQVLVVLTDILCVLRGIEPASGAAILNRGHRRELDAFLLVLAWTEEWTVSAGRLVYARCS